MSGLLTAGARAILAPPVQAHPLEGRRLGAPSAARVAVAETMRLVGMRSSADRLLAACTARDANAVLDLARISLLNLASTSVLSHREAHCLEACTTAQRALLALAKGRMGEGWAAFESVVAAAEEARGNLA